jgi:hypothetical protein
MLRSRRRLGGGWTTRFGLSLVAAVLALHTAEAQTRARVLAEKFDSVKADLSKLGELEKEYYQRNQAFTVDTAALQFKPTSGAQVSISYASTRAWAASATHPMLEPFVCFAMVTSPKADSWPEQPFCRDSRRGRAASAIVKAGAATEVATPPKKVVPPAFR